MTLLALPPQTLSLPSLLSSSSLTFNLPLYLSSLKLQRRRPPGSSPDLPSVLLNSDVVPSEPHKWHHSPFSSHIDPSGHILARGSHESGTTSDATSLLGKYELGRVLGRGTFAKVYEARSISDRSAVSIKVIDKSKTDSAMEPCIVAEVAAMRRLHSHPNILKIHEVMATRSKIYLVVELASGGELFSRLRRLRRFNEPAAHRYFQQLVSALHFCHQNSVAHRRFNEPAARRYLLLDGDGNLKVSDFGLSALPEQLRDGLLRQHFGFCL